MGVVDLKKNWIPYTTILREKEWKKFEKHVNSTVESRSNIF